MTGFYLAKSGFVGSETEYWLTPQQESMYVVKQYNSTHFYMQNSVGRGYVGYDGYEYESTSGTLIVGFALNNLTSGRTWKETVLLAGNFSLANILVPSYTNIIVYGNITKNANGPIFLLSSVRDVSIDGGYYYGQNLTY